MKFKCRPEDFRVEERTAFVATDGPFALYRLRKTSLGTPEAVDAIVRKFKVPRSAVSFGGLKDRHATTEQHLTIADGPDQSPRERNWQLNYIGQADRPFVSDDIAANHFEIVVRDLTAGEVEHVHSQFANVERDGFPNYFDDQRFGSVGKSGEFVAAALCRQDYERALWLAIADENANDRPREAAEKRWLRKHWGNWRRLIPDLSDRKLERIAKVLLDRPGDFVAGFSCIRHDMRVLLVSAFQSHLWNRALSHWLANSLSEAQHFSVRLKTATVQFHRRLDDFDRAQLSELSLPLPTARTVPPEDENKQVFGEVLKEHGVTWQDLRIHKPDDLFFSKGDRKAVVIPTGLSMKIESDDLRPGRQKATLSFDLPRGAYATILLKALFTSPIVAEI